MEEIASIPGENPSWGWRRTVEEAAPDHICLRISGRQQRCVGEALRIFARRSTYAFEMGKLSRPLPVPILAGDVLEVPRDLDSVKMLEAALGITLLRNRSMPANVIDGVIDRLNRETKEMSPSNAPHIMYGSRSMS